MNYSEKVIISEAMYDRPYRFKVWAALLDDLAITGKGHRAYHSHIFNSLQFWEKTGYRFLSDRGGLINFEQLTTDDLFGFIGKKTNAPSGPGRFISDQKLAVIDVFLKAKFPQLAASFDKSKFLHAFASVNIEFLSRPNTKFISEDFDERSNRAEGFYIGAQNLMAPKIKEAYLHAESFKSGYDIPVFIVRRLPGAKYCVVHRVEFPIRPDRFELGTEQRKSAEIHQDWLENNARAGTVIYSGIGIATNNERGNAVFDLSLILRERTFHCPYHSTLSFSESDRPNSQTYDNAILESSSKTYLDKFFNMSRSFANINRSDKIFSIDFIEEINNLYEELGLEV